MQFNEFGDLEFNENINDIDKKILHDRLIAKLHFTMGKLNIQNELRIFSNENIKNLSNKLDKKIETRKMLERCFNKGM